MTSEDYAVGAFMFFMLVLISLMIVVILSH